MKYKTKLIKAQFLRRTSRFSGVVNIQDVKNPIIAASILTKEENTILLLNEYCLDSKFQNLIFLPRKASSLTEWKPLSYSEKKPALLKQRRHKRRPKRESSLIPQSKLSSSPLEKKLQRTQLSIYRLAFLSILVFGIT